MRERSRAGNRRGLMFGSPEGRTRALPSENRVVERGATRARPEYRRVMSAPDRQSPICASCLNKESSTNHARVVSGTKHRAPITRHDLRHRPVSALVTRSARRQARQRITGGRLNPVCPLREKRPPTQQSGPPTEPRWSPPPPVFCQHVRTNAERPSPRLVRHVSGPSCSRSADMMAWALQVGKNRGWLWCKVLELFGR